MRPVPDADYVIALRSEVDAALDRPGKSSVFLMDQKVAAVKLRLRLEREALANKGPHPDAKMHFLTPEQIAERDARCAAAERIEYVRATKMRRVARHASTTYHAKWMAARRKLDPNYGRRGMHALSASPTAQHKRQKRETDPSYGQ